MMKRIVEYETAFSSRNETLSMVVQRYIADGWQPFGNPYIDKNGVDRQAIVKHEEAKPKAKKKGAKNED